MGEENKNIFIIQKMERACLQSYNVINKIMKYHSIAKIL